MIEVAHSSLVEPEEGDTSLSGIIDAAEAISRIWTKCSVNLPTTSLANKRTFSTRDRRSFNCDSAIHKSRLTGQKALDAREAGLALVEAMININQQLASATTEEAINNIGTTVKVLLKKTKESSKNLPFAVRMEASQYLNELAHHIQLLHKNLQKSSSDPKSRQKN